MAVDILCSWEEWGEKKKQEVLNRGWMIGRWKMDKWMDGRVMDGEWVEELMADG